MNIIVKEAVDLIKFYESLHDGNLKQIGLQPKMCPAGVWTVGYGHALRTNTGTFLKGAKDEKEAYKQFPNLSVLEACNMLEQDLKVFSHLIENYLKHSVNDRQFSAMISLSYNIGLGAFSTSSVLRNVNAGKFTLAANSFKLWNKGHTLSGSFVIMPGLVNRRAAEKKLFLS